MSKHLENGLMMFTTKENCTLTVKDYLYMCIKTKQTKIQQTNASKSTMYPGSHTLNFYTIFQFYAAMTGGRFFLFVFLVVRSEQCPSELLSMMETRTLYIGALGRRCLSDCRIRKREIKSRTHSFR